MIQSPAQGRTVLETIVDAIVARFDPRRIVLFGSHARGDARADSDYDLMVELASVENEWKMSWEIKEALPRGIADVDITVQTRARFDERRNDPGTFGRLKRGSEGRGSPLRRVRVVAKSAGVLCAPYAQYCQGVHLAVLP